LGGSSEFTIGDVAEELGDAIGEQADHAPILRLLNRPQQLIFIVMVILVVVLSVIWAKNIFFPYQGPANIPEEAPQAAQVTLFNGSDVIGQFLDSDFTILAIQYVSAAKTPGKRMIRFSVPGQNGHLEPVQVVIYNSISDMVRDQQTQQTWASTSDIVATGNAMLVYSKNLEGLPMEERLLQRFAEITGS
jgi:hypothetical protein